MTEVPPFYDGERWEWQCEGCTRNSWPMQDAADAAGINAYGITFAILADGPHEELAAFRDFMGYTAPWYSNAHLDHPTVSHTGHIACYLRREDKIYLTYTTTARGDEVMSPLFGLLDMTVYGRREEWEDSPEGWPQLPTHSFLRTTNTVRRWGPETAADRCPSGRAPASPGRRTNRVTHVIELAHVGGVPVEELLAAVLGTGTGLISVRVRLATCLAIAFGRSSRRIKAGHKDDYDGTN